MKSFSKIFMITLTIILIAGIWRHSAVSQPPLSNLKEEKIPYLSITSTNKDLRMHFFTYNITGKQINEVAEIPLTAQYPLGAVNLQNNCVYYSERDANRCDQLMEMNLKTKNKKKLTTNIFAFNYIIPVEDKILLAFFQKSAHNAEPAVYDLNTGQLVLWNKDDHDTFVQCMTLNPFSQKVYVSKFSLKERKDKGHQARDKNTLEVVPAVHQVLEYNIKGQKLQDIYAAEEQIMCFSVSSNGNQGILRSAPLLFADRKLYLFDMKTKARQELIVPGYDGFEDVCFSPDQKGIYFTAAASGKSNNGLYYYDFKTKQVQEILYLPDTYINNFQLLTYTKSGHN